MLDGRKEFPERNHTVLSVIIPTLNEVNYLPELLDALKQQTRQADEIIVADAGSTDGTVELARQSGARVIIGGMPAVGRNAGARAANGNVFLFLDADVVPPSNFIAVLLEEFERKDYDVATCLIEPLGDHSLDKVICRGTNLYFRMIQSVSPHAPGFCIVAKRAAHERLEGFDETLMLSEDIDYARRARRAGRFGFVSRTRIPVSMRRIGKEGLIKLGMKYAWCEMAAFTGKPVRRAPFLYEFGKFSGRQEETQRAIIRMDSAFPLSAFGFLPPVSSLVFSTIGAKVSDLMNKIVHLTLQLIHDSAQRRRHRGDPTAGGD